MSSRILPALPLLVLLIGACAARRTSSEPSSPPTYHVVDVMADFWAFWDETADLPPESRAQAFDRRVIRPHARAFRFVARSRKRRVHRAYVQAVPRIIPKMRAAYARVPEALERSWTRLLGAFPDMRWTGEVYIMPTFGQFDGAVQGRPGHMSLVLGIETIATEESPTALDVLIVHEMFHLHHADAVPELGLALYERIWREGLAAYVSRELTGATTNDALLEAELEQQARPLQATIAAEVRTKLQSKRAGDRARFLYGAKPNDLPARTGYFIGLEIADRLARSRSMAELSTLQGQPLRDAMEQSLRELEDETSLD